ncbi:hypothetical protein FGO68_gene10672 [Halteria grandinella]|uniref:Uncharacterized protein n=1 Tax=Halteria grandinella TaxID=5974 RepID=A0A8J8SVZ4_HALGN|nr:hypothetical protein FGO68_gene10672 [Halteria grandinella]
MEQQVVLAQIQQMSLRTNMQSQVIQTKAITSRQFRQPPSTVIPYSAIPIQRTCSPTPDLQKVSQPDLPALNPSSPSKS